ncbi:alpha/beta fold hydrolase [Nocardioides sp. dk4132]|uniref:alpha/beta fold hydrolase n=1 Tax=unclassified Nocardioides TaxID=2615069 RepID=UPI0012951B9A|nr:MULTISPECIES: alpha/beta hydrolase [unclassified Nocardioides]MQW77584.1 alpha/beta fold hydrolase [Nocardioides sp. dk4132]QGA06113.1 alpha/beta fold hydrolase [Nocardioides sp. dk884]
MHKPPVIFVHGLGSTYAANWVRSGWADLVAAEGRTPLGHDMAGHGDAPLLEPPDDTGPGRLCRQIEESGGPADVVGFSAGSVLALTAAVQRPDIFHRLVLMGTGDRSYLLTLEQKRASLAAGMDSPTMAGVRLAAERAGNDFAQVLESSHHTHPVPSFEEMSVVRCPVLIVLGEDDFVGPADRLLDALPDARLVSLRRTDHFSTTQRFEAQEAVLKFLAED